MMKRQEWSVRSHYEPSVSYSTLNLANMLHEYSRNRICNTTNISSHFHTDIAIDAPWSSPGVPYNPVWDTSCFIKARYKDGVICFSTGAVVLYNASQVVLPAHGIYHHYQRSQGQKCFCHFVFLATEVIRRITFDWRSRMWVGKVTAEAILGLKWVFRISHQLDLQLIEPVQSAERGSSVAAVVAIRTVYHLLNTQHLQGLPFYRTHRLHCTHHAESPASTTRLLVSHLGDDVLIPPVKS